MNLWTDIITLLNVGGAAPLEPPNSVSTICFRYFQIWIQLCVNHLCWSATPTIIGDGKLAIAKFNSFLGHIVNQHENHKDPLFIRCAHGGRIAQRKLLIKDYRPLHVEYVA